MLVRSIAFHFVAVVMAATPLGDLIAVEPGTLDAISNRIASARATRIVCFGDSITGAYYHTGGQRAWCDFLGFALQRTYPRANLEMVNAGISGNTTTDALARLDRDVIDQRPHLVVISFGMNDVTRVPIDEFRSNLSTMVDRLHNSGATVLMCTPNSVIENQARPNQKLLRYTDVVIEIGEAKRVEVVDLFRLWQELRAEHPTDWMLAMSDEIHPNMNGHRQFANWIAAEISGRQVHLDDLQPPTDSLYHTLDRLDAGEHVKIVTSSPYDAVIAEFLRSKFSAAKIETINWPSHDLSNTQSLIQQQVEWAKRIRALHPDLVIPIAPTESMVIETNRLDGLQQVAGQFEWMLNYSFPFSGKRWDVVPVVPAASSQSKAHSIRAQELARRIIHGKDVLFVDVNDLENRHATNVAPVQHWLDRRLRSWLGARRKLPETNDHVWVPAQSWPHRPGPREIKVSIHYPGGRLSKVNGETGIMLTLHNWGGRGCAGTASPDALASRLNVIALCVDYLQSGSRPSDGEQPPYDFGYFQSLDALRALAYVRDGLIQTNHAYDDRRVFCTGGSGGGNVTLMANKLAPRTFACVIDMCGMARLSDDIAYGEIGGSKLNAFWSREQASPNYLSVDQQQVRFVGEPNHLDQMRRMESSAKIIVVHGVNDASCPYPDAEQMVVNLRAAGLDVDSHFIHAERVDGSVFTTTGHALGNRTEIVFAVAGNYLDPRSPAAIRRAGPTDFERKEDVIYRTDGGQFVISYADGNPIGRFVANQDLPRSIETSDP